MKIRTTRFQTSAMVIAIALSVFSPMPFASPAAMPKSGNACTKLNQIIHMDAKIYTCVKSGKKLVWSKGVPESQGSSKASGNFGSTGSQSSSSNMGQQTGNQSSSNSDTKFLYMLRIGMKCSTNGVFGFSGGSLTICKSNVVKYALSSDIPAAPAKGYSSRPSWYPTLWQQLGMTTEPQCAPSSIKFTSPIIPLDQLAPSIPYGAMIGGHVTPIDHAYLGIKSLYKDPSQRTESDYVPVTAPADGTIVSIQNLGSPTSIRVVISHGCNLVSVYMVLNKLSGVLAKYQDEYSKSGASGNVDLPIKAGQEFARQRDNAMDFNIFDGTSWLSGFANPFSYVSQDTTKPFLADPLPFFTSEIRSALESQFQRTTSPRIGKIDYDIIGAASGNWFLDGTFGYGGHLTSEFVGANSEIQGGQVNGKNDYSWSHLALAPHPVDPTKWIFSTGWWKDPAGDPNQFLINISSGQVAPDKLTSASGVVVYQLTQFSINEPAGSPARLSGANAPFAVGYTLGGGAAVGIVALQVNADGSLSVEVNPSVTNPSNFSGFSSAKRIYRH